MDGTTPSTYRLRSAFTTQSTARAVLATRLRREYTEVVASAGAAKRSLLIRLALSSAFLPFAEAAIRKHGAITPPDA